MQMSFLCLQNVRLVSLKQQHPVTSVSHVLLTPRGYTLELCFVLAWMASSGPQQTPLLDHAQVTSLFKSSVKMQKVLENQNLVKFGKNLSDCLLLTFRLLTLSPFLCILSNLHLSGLPSAPQDLVATTSAGKLLLSWSPPKDTGGRNDITYSIECQRCEGIVCQSCGEKIRYEPASMGLTDTKVSVSDLDAHLNYTFTVEAHSGVSLLIGQEVPQANRPPSSSALTTSLLYTGGCYWYEAV